MARSRGLADADAEDQATPELTEAIQASAAQARSRLCRVMDLFQAEAQPVQGDGNCQFRAVSVQLYGEEEHHVALRARVVQQLLACPERYAGFMPEPYDEYVKRIARDGEWGDNVTLQAMSNMLGCQINVLTDVPGAECVEVFPVTGSDAKEPPLCLTFLTEVHYDAARISLIH